MKIIFPPGRTSIIDEAIFLQDGSSLTGAGLTGLLYNSAGLTCYYVRSSDTASNAVSLATMTGGAFTSGGFLEIDATNMPGLYWFCPPDAAFVEGASSVTFYFLGAANLVPRPIQYGIAGPPVLAGVAGGTPTTTSIATTSSGFSTSTTGNPYAGMALLFTSGANKLLARRITASVYSAGTTTLTVAAFPTAPSAADTFEILGA